MPFLAIALADRRSGAAAIGGVVLIASSLLLLFQRRRWVANAEKRTVETKEAALLTGSNSEMIDASDDPLCGYKMRTTFVQGSMSNNNKKKKPTVVFVHGFGCMSMEFDAVSKVLVEQGVNVFGYDRILFVESYQHKLPPRTADVLAKELHTLLIHRRQQHETDGSMEPPYLFVGHSYGGLIAQYYARLYPEDVCGLVLIDPAHEHQFDAFPKDFTFGFDYICPTLFRIYQSLAWTGMLQAMDAIGAFNFPPLYLMERSLSTRERAAWLYSNGNVWHRVADELTGCNETFRSLQQEENGWRRRRQVFQRDNAEPRQLPVALVIACRRQYSPTLFPQAVTDAFIELHKDEIPGKRFLAQKSDHWVHMEQPQVVIDAIDHVLSKLE